jgi:hypothetical protein
VVVCCGQQPLEAQLLDRVTLGLEAPTDGIDGTADELIHRDRAFLARSAPDQVLGHQVDQITRR